MLVDAIVALDIETTGLDPSKHRVVAVGLVGPQGRYAILDGDEKRLLAKLETFVRKIPAHAYLVTWNGEEFDLPFLAGRFSRLGVRTTLKLSRKRGRGKYGGRVYEVHWGGKGHVDIAPMFRQIAETKQIPWNLKPVARAMLGNNPIEEDRRGPAIAALSAQRLERYVLSDAEITRQLALSLPTPQSDD
jgi:DNA polymerase elongation subunit (family B)